MQQDNMTFILSGLSESATHIELDGSVYFLRNIQQNSSTGPGLSYQLMRVTAEKGVLWLSFRLDGSEKSLKRFDTGAYCRLGLHPGKRVGFVLRSVDPTGNNKKRVMYHFVESVKFGGEVNEDCAKYGFRYECYAKTVGDDWNAGELCLLEHDERHKKLLADGYSLVRSFGPGNEPFAYDVFVAAITSSKK